MATYHVKVSGDDGTGDGSEGNPWRTINHGMAQLAAGGLSWDSSPDELAVWFDPAPFVESVLGPGSNGLRVIGVDGSGVRADEEGWNREERPVIAPSSGTGLRLDGWTHFRGFLIDGSSAGNYDGAIGKLAADPFWLEDVIVRDWQKQGIGFLAAESRAWRCEVHDCGRWGIYALGAPDVDIRSVLVTGCLWGGIYVPGPGSIVEHATAIGCGSYLPGFAALDGGELVNQGTIVNSIALDNATEYGIRTYAGSGFYNCSHSSSASYHTIADFFVYPGTSHDLDLDPLLDAEDRPSAVSPCRLTGLAGFPGSPLLDADGRPFASPPSRGAFEYPGGGVVSALADKLVVWSGDIDGADVIAGGGVEPFRLGRDALRYSILASLFSDRRAEEDDELPGGDGDSPRGWWHDSVSGQRYGSRLWLLERATVTDETAALSESYAREALEWLLEDGIATSLDVRASRSSDESRIEMEIAIWRDGRRLGLRFADLWEALSDGR